ncbi:pyridoxamine 5'-phosphate oxidase family protein [Hufsiella ginkgonis]|uniref:Pyridoxamine 5'-phosphate oxidase family protein n=1 Tax=Hufsiella ginkgonis TaxID=2695274 RepID=A0A7K1XUU9_9SPHI|nr:pyridoxamine 5'-phosphate oxidase family protein [Hufsiella ginkgonis]MXV14577.1 pyridoxamine 5'-phosphate oxidase family protein [Hufsiella ginkgonis]
MDSINKNQPEDNFEGLEGAEAIKKIKDTVAKTDTCFFCTNIKTGLPFSVRPMSVQKVDDEGNLWFLSAKDSVHNQEIGQDPFVQLLFQESPHAGFLNVYGIAEITDDKSKIEELWTPMVKTWFTEGKDDPRISVIRVEPSQGYYWDNKHGKAVAFLKMAVGMVMGKTLDDSIEGNLSL